MAGEAALPPLRLVVALGNPGPEYALTRHNAGWQVADKALDGAAAACKAAWQPWNGELHVLQFRDGGRKLMLLKPLTYMNASGEAVQEVFGHFALSPGEMLVVCDCLDLPCGRLRLRMNGSSGGQRGVKSVADCLGTTDFPRLRIGIGRPESAEASIIDYVLSPWASGDETKRLAALDRAAAAIRKSVETGVESAVEFCNAWRPPDSPDEPAPRSVTCGES